MPSPIIATRSVRWQRLIDQLETRDRWTAHCARMVERHAAAADAPPRGAPVPPAGERPSSAGPTVTRT